MDLSAILLIYVDRSGGPDACWPWVGGRFPAGYGRFEGPRDPDGKRHVYLAHRLAYQAENGIELKRNDRHILICHRCDNPSCCNPSHLFAGSPADNMTDMLTKGRGVVGSQRQNAKLNEGAALAILSSSATHKTLAEQYGVCYQAIQHVRARRQWKHVSGGRRRAP